MLHQLCITLLFGTATVLIDFIAVEIGCIIECQLILVYLTYIWRILVQVVKYEYAISHRLIITLI